MNPLEHAPLGKNSDNPQSYDPGLLFGISRQINREKLGLAQAPPFVGVDIWNAYELSWLNMKGKPQIAVATFLVPANSPNIIESKSWKLYLNSLNNRRFKDEKELLEILKADLSKVAQATVSASLNSTETILKNGFVELEGQLLDRLDIEVDLNQSPNAELLSCDKTQGLTEECLVSHLIRSNCPVTGQPDWASLQIKSRSAITKNSTNIV